MMAMPNGGRCGRGTGFHCAFIFFAFASVVLLSSSKDKSVQSPSGTLRAPRTAISSTRSLLLRNQMAPQCNSNSQPKKDIRSVPFSVLSISRIRKQGRRGVLAMVRSSEIDGDEDEPLDIDSSLAGVDEKWDEEDEEEEEEEEEPEDDEDVDGETVESVVASVGEAGNDEEWFQSLGQSHAIDQETSTNTIQPVDDPSTDEYVALDAVGEKDSVKLSDIKSTLADITKEIKELKMELSDSEEEFDEDDAPDDDDEDYRNWPIDYASMSQPRFKPPTDEELEEMDTSNAFYVRNPDSLTPEEDYFGNDDLHGW